MNPNVSGAAAGKSQVLSEWGGVTGGFDMVK